MSAIDVASLLDSDNSTIIDYSTLLLIASHCHGHRIVIDVARHGVSQEPHEGMSFSVRLQPRRTLAALTRSSS